MLVAPFIAIRQVFPVMKSQCSGRIINIASINGLIGFAGKAGYNSAKHGVIGLTKVAALEGAPYGITVNAICPGYVKTPLVEKQIADQAKAHNMSEADVINKVMLYKQAVKEFISLETLGQTALLLAADHAGTITGTAIPVDGGWNAQ